MKILGIDPGYAHMGLSVARLDPVKLLEFESTEVIETSRTTDKSVRLADDLSKRCTELGRYLMAKMAREEPVAICIEVVAFPFGKMQTSVVSGLGRVRGMIDMLAIQYGVPVIEVGSQAVKVKALGTRSADKAQVQLALEARFPELRDMWPSKTAMHEHAADSAGVIYAASDRSEFIAAKRGHR